ncbi:MAG TPA: tetratricopeptide repeat protein, partial [Anaerolineales bacterium]
MKKFILAALVLMFALQACTLPALAPAKSTITPTPSLTFTITPSPTVTITPTAIPSPTPTPPPEMRVAEGDHALFNGDYEAAQDAYSTALSNSSDPAIFSAALLGLGRYYYLTGVYSNALTEFRQIIDEYPSSSQVADAYYFLGETFMQLDRYSEAADAYSSYLTIQPGVLDAFFNEKRGDALSAAGDSTEALNAYTTAVQSPRLPTNFSLELKLAQAYVSLGDYTTAMVMYDDIFTRTSSDSIKAQVDYTRGQMYSVLGQSEQATTAYVDAVINYPKAYYAFLSLVELVNTGYPIDDLQRGIIDYNAGQYGVALEAFNRFLTFNDASSSTALYYKGLILRQQDDYPSAIAMWDFVIQGDPSSLEWDAAWEQKAYTQWAYQNDFSSGEQTLLDFVSTAPTHPRAAEFLFDAGRTAERDDRLEDAALIWQRIPAEYPNS